MHAELESSIIIEAGTPITLNLANIHSIILLSKQQLHTSLFFIQAGSTTIDSTFQLHAKLLPNTERANRVIHIAICNNNNQIK
jgi:hypothetical protein